MAKKIFFISIAALALIVIGFAALRSQKQRSAAAADIKNATYIIEGAPVALVNGISEVPAAPGSSINLTTRYFGDEAQGDLNGDGVPDTAFILTQDGGGSGTFYYAVAAIKTSTGYQGTNGIFLGDRIAPQSVEIRGGEVIVNYADRRPDESFAAKPSVGVSKYLTLKNGVLSEQ